MVLSPGIDPGLPLALNFSSRNIETIGELELGWRSVNVPVIAITGTNGKTTTTELLAQMLNACGQRTIACGNIGKPLSEVALENRDLDVLTVEVSSFQLETIRTFHPSISVWLNFAPDHLDRYRSIAEYRAAKLRIFDNQTADDVAVVNGGEPLPETAARIVSFSAYAEHADFRLAGGSIVYRGTSSFADGRYQVARLAQYREHHGGVGGRFIARFVFRTDVAVALRLRTETTSM
jgi:UDP-N-acetylmuramoylalanine--D-glutamate ligase